MSLLSSRACTVVVIPGAGRCAGDG
jgi:hypothetical protein